MSALIERLQALSPEKRKLYEQLLAARHTRGASNAFDQEALQSFGRSADRTKAGTRKFYDAINQQLASTPFGDFAEFLNYGFLGDSSEQFARVELPAHFLNRNSAQLVLELIGDCDLDRKDILDVGCGRGGTLRVVEQFMHPRSTTGVDLSSAAIVFCNRHHKRSRTRFLEADAEELPFASASFDVVTNVESSHSYPVVEAFYSEVWRVLKPGGYFLYTDVWNLLPFERHEQTLSAMGFLCERKRDITQNVLLSCRETATRRAQAFEQIAERSVIQDFLSTPESSVFAAMQSGAASYRMFKLRKHVSPGDH